MIKRRDLLLTLPAAAAALHLPATARPRTDAIVLGLTLEPAPGLDPTAGAASSIAEVTLYNVYETLTRIHMDGSVGPLLAERWEVSPDLRTTTFHLRRDARFSNGEPFDAATVKFSFERAAADRSTNKDRQFFAGIERIDAIDDHTVAITLARPNPDHLFYFGQATAIMVEPRSAADNNTRPVGTGPYVLDRWAKGSSIVLKARPDWRDADGVKIKRATFRIISDPAAQVAAILAGDIDVFARTSPRALAQFRQTPRLQTLVSNSRAKTVLAINNAREPLSDVRVRRAISRAIDRAAVIAGAADGLGVAIGSHYAPTAPGYIDTTGINPHDPDGARALLAEAGVKAPLELSLILPPPAYARQGGEVILSELAKIGIRCKVQNVEWAAWLANVYGGAHDYDLTIISHVEPFDLVNFTKPDYYWGYHNPDFDQLFEQEQSTANGPARNALLAQLQTLLAEDAVLGWLYSPQWVTAADKDLRGLWTDMPIFVNDLGALSWG